MKPGSLIPLLMLLALEILMTWTVEGASKGELESLRWYPGARVRESSA